MEFFPTLSSQFWYIYIYIVILLAPSSLETHIWVSRELGASKITNPELTHGAGHPPRVYSYCYIVLDDNTIFTNKC